MDRARAWEGALEHEIASAHGRGVPFARRRDVQGIALASSEQRRFDRLYNQGARRGARELARYGIAGEAVFERAQALIHHSGSTH